MMSTIERRSSSHSTLTTSLLMVLLLILLGGVDKAQAQLTTGTDINNTNTGNVGIGTTNPSASFRWILDRLTQQDTSPPRTRPRH